MKQLEEFDLLKSEDSRKKFLVYFFSSIILLALLSFGIRGLIAGKIGYSINIFIFITLTLSNILVLKFLNKFLLTAYGLLFLMMILVTILFAWLAAETTGLYWYYGFPPLAVPLLGNKKGTILSLILIVSTSLLYFIPNSFVTTQYSLELYMRFVIIYFVVLSLINFSELSRARIERYFVQAISNLKIKHDELTSAEEELRQNNEELQTLNELIKEREQRLETILNNQGEGFGILDLNNTFLLANPAVCKIFETNENELIGKKIKEFVDQEQWEIISNQTKKISQKQKVDFEFIIKQNENNHKHLIATAVPDVDFEENITGIIATIRDITEIKKAEQLVNEQNNQQKILINNLPAYIYFKDINLKYVLVNNSFAETMKLPISEIIGKTDKDLVSKELADIFMEIDNKIISSKTPQLNFEMEYFSNGSQKWSSTSKVPYFDETGNVIGIIGIVTDITENKKAEQVLINQKQTIEQTHKQLTDNINYAKTIQDALLTSEELIKKYLNNYFIIYKPKETVSGDFYYINKINEFLILAVADCTGHGVAGGFITMLGITYIHETIRTENSFNSGQILNQLRNRFKRTFKVFGTENQNGMDIVLCVVDTNTNVLQYAGANLPLYLIRQGQLTEYKPTKNPIGFYPLEKDFANQEVKLQANDNIYLASDGFQDQFGIGDNWKFTKRRFKQTLLEIHNLPLSEQKEKSLTIFESWKNSRHQIDDITILGIKW